MHEIPLLKSGREECHVINNLVDEIKQIIANELDANLKIEEIDENSSLFEDGIGLDSIAVVELIALLEEHFGFEFADSELGTDLFSNINTLAKFISTKTQNLNKKPVQAT